jgi:hypothetical protein
VQVEGEREIVDPQRARDDRLLRVPLPDREPQGSSQRGEAERGHDMRADPPRAEQPDHQDDGPAAEQRNQRREAGEVDVRAFEVGGGEGVERGDHRFSHR